MNSRLPLLQILFKSLLASLLVAMCSTAVVADITRPLSGSHRMRISTDPRAHVRHFGRPRSSPSGVNWIIRDLGLPAQTSAALPVPLIPTPYAINEHGDVAISVCPAVGCGSADAYVYDYRLARWIALAKLPGQPNPPPPAQYIPRALNDRGEIVGAVVRSVGGTIVSSPVLWTRRGAAGSRIAMLDATPGDQGTAFGINNTGLIVGSVYTGPYQLNSFEVGTAVLFTGGTPILLGANAPGTGSDAFGINDAGVAVGDVFAGLAASYSGGVAIPIPQQDQCPAPFDVCDQNAGFAINKTGDVLGNYVTNFFDMATQSYVGFLWKNNTFSTLAPTCFDSDCPIQYQPGDTDYVLSINARDDFVGYFDGQPWVSFSPVGDANGLLPPSSGWQIITVAAINDGRQIVGQGYHAGYGTNLRAFLLEPRR